jgi:hypothetical protein
MTFLECNYCSCHSNLFYFDNKTICYNCLLETKRVCEKCGISCNLINDGWSIVCETCKEEEKEEEKEED